MSDTGDQLHPNWRALASVHIPLKRFIKEGTTELREETGPSHDKHEISGIAGDEIKEFYEKLVSKENERHSQNALESKQLLIYNTYKSQPAMEAFDVRKYFQCAMENKVEELKQINYEGENINVCDNYGWSALMMASCEGANDAVEFLLRLGVDRYIKDRTGKTAKDLAYKKGYLNIVKLLAEDQRMSKEDIRATIEENDKFYCEICKQNFIETSKRHHYSSTVHQFLKKSSLSPNKLLKFNIASHNRGLQLMVKQGWDKESGLGPCQSGRLYPIKTVMRKQRTGLGIEQEAGRVTHFEPYDRKAVLRNSKKEDMAKTSEQKCIEILKSTEEVADSILVNKQELINLDRRRQQTREAIRELEKNRESSEKNVWITIGSMLVKLDRQKALNLLKKDQLQIEHEINILQSDQKILVNKHRDLEHFSPYSGTNIKPLDRKEFNALKANLPML